MCKIGIKFQYASQALWAYEHVFRKLPRCALIGACALIRTNTVMNIALLIHIWFEVKFMH